MRDELNDLASQTPVQIDTTLMQVLAEHDGAVIGRATVKNLVHDKAGDERNYNSKRREWKLTYPEALGRVTEQAETDKLSAHLLERLAKNQAILEGLQNELDVIHDEYTRRPWPRAWLCITNGKGHVHATRGCRTLYPTSLVQLRVEFSGSTQEEIIEAAGERACTVCYPDAPVEVLNRPTSIFSDDERKAAEARAEKLAKRNAKDSAKVFAEYIDTWRFTTKRREFSTARAAAIVAVEELCDVDRCANSDTNRIAEIAAHTSNFQAIVDALAAKDGRPVETWAMELRKKAEAKIKRDAREAEKHARRLGFK